MNVFNQGRVKKILKHRAVLSVKPNLDIKVKLTKNMQAAAAHFWVQITINLVKITEFEFWIKVL